MNTNLENFDFLSRCYTTNKQIPDELKEWLFSCFENWRSGQSLSDAFGVYDNVDERIDRRNHYLRCYAENLSGLPWTKAGYIIKEIDKIRQKRRQTCPVLESIDHIYKLPDSRRQIYNILKQ